MIKIRRPQRLSEVIHSRADINIGKNGLSENVVNEIKKRLKKKGIIKVRVLKSAREILGISRKDVARLVAEKTGAELVEVRGYTFILRVKNRKTS